MDFGFNEPLITDYTDVYYIALPFIQSWIPERLQTILLWFPAVKFVIKLFRKKLYVSYSDPIPDDFEDRYGDLLHED